MSGLTIATLARIAERAPPRMKSADFVALHRPRLGAIKHFPVVEFADYERRLARCRKLCSLCSRRISARRIAP